MITIDCTPTWEAVLPIYLNCLLEKKATASAKEGARKELQNMARLADERNKYRVYMEELEYLRKALYFDTETKKNLLTSALEGGSNYWYYLGDDANAILKPFRKELGKGKPYVDYFFRALERGYSIPVRDAEDEDEVLGHISMESICRAELLMATKHASHYADAKAERDDATTADVWFQLAVLGDIVYG